MGSYNVTGSSYNPELDMPEEFGECDWENEDEMNDDQKRQHIRDLLAEHHEHQALLIPPSDPLAKGFEIKKVNCEHDIVPSFDNIRIMMRSAGDVKEKGFFMIERVHVWWYDTDMDPNTAKHCTMFVDESGLIKRLPINPIATIIYNNANALARRGLPIQPIAGPAVFFNYDYDAEYQRLHPEEF